MDNKEIFASEVYWRYREIEDDVVGELLYVACWFSPYDKEAYVKRLQIQNLMIMVRQKMEALDNLYQTEFNELHERLANRDNHIHALEAALQELLEKYRSEIELSECLTNLDAKGPVANRAAPDCLPPEHSTPSGMSSSVSLVSPPTKSLDPPGFSASVKERIRLLNQGFLNATVGSVERTICTNVDHRGNNRLYSSSVASATSAPSVCFSTGSETDSGGSGSGSGASSSSSKSVVPLPPLQEEYRQLPPDTHTMNSSDFDDDTSSGADDEVVAENNTEEDTDEDDSAGASFSLNDFD